MVETENYITSILNAYEQQEKRRALGGIYALAGFDYQLRFYLADFIESIVNQSTNLNTAGHVFLEALSDVVKKNENSDLICIQVKRTLTATSLKDAAFEVVAIDRFLDNHYPSIRNQVKFNLIAAQGSAEIQWSDIPETHETRTTIDKLINKNRLLPIRIEPDPWWRAITLTWPHLKDPYGFLRFALDKAISRQPIAADAQRIRDDICDRFKRDQLAKMLPGQLLTREDFQFKENPSRYLDVGREITLARFRDRQYIGLNKRLNTLYTNIFEYKDTFQRKLRSNVPVFWLSGRSGAGKSVLLVQTLERLVLEGWRVLWLKGNAELLEPALLAIKEAHEQDRPDFIAVDDLYDHDARNRIDLSSLGEFIDESDHKNWPVILTCGPTEFADSFEEDATYQGFNLNRYSICPLEAYEANEIESWYQQRTGKIAQRGSAYTQAAEEDNGLFISLALELEHGDIKTFAKRFAQRVELTGLNKALILPLALNRLYLRAPYDWLTKEDREILATLNHEGDFNLLETADEGQIIRLTHPHLADALYIALRKPANYEAYTNDLADAFKRALTERNANLASQLLRLFSGREQGIATERLNIVKLSDLAVKCSNHWIENPTFATNPDDQADMMTSWACWVTTASNIVTVFNINMFSAALDSLDTAYKAWSICWQHLSNYYPHNEELFSWAKAHLSDTLFIRHPTWSFVWEYCLMNDSKSSKAWNSVGLDWLQRSLRRPDWHIVWKKLLPVNNSNIERNPVFILGRRRLHAEMDGPDWAFVLQDLLHLAEPRSSTLMQLINLGKVWLIGREHRVEWTYVWRALLDQKDELPETLPLSELLKHGGSWLTGREDRVQWAHVWQALIDHKDELPESLTLSELMDRGALWMIGREDRPEWIFVWRTLLAQRDQLPESLTVSELMERGALWMNGREDRSEWTYAWQALFAKRDELPDSFPLSKLLDCGVAWLRGRDDFTEWPFIWRALFEKKDAFSESLTLCKLLQYGTTWLNGHDHCAEWAFIWQDLIKLQEALPENLLLGGLLERGATWLKRHEDYSEEWSYVLEQLLEHKFQDEDFSKIAANWLLHACEKPEWPILAAKFIIAMPQHSASKKMAAILVTRIEAEPNKGLWFKTEKLTAHLVDIDYLPLEVKDWLQSLGKRREHPVWEDAYRSLNEGIPIKGFLVIQKGTGAPIITLENGLSAIFPDCKLTTSGYYDFYVLQINRDRDTVRVGIDKAPRLTIGEYYSGVVKELTDYGLFVTIGEQTGLLHKTQCSNWFDLAKKYPKSSEIYVKVLDVVSKGPKLQYAGPELVKLINIENLKDGEAYRRQIIRTKSPELKIGENYSGFVKELTDYGLFVTIDEQTGLLHKTQCSNWIDLVKKYPKGSEIYVKVLDMISKGPKLQYAGPELVKLISTENLKVGETYRQQVNGTKPTQLKIGRNYSGFVKESMDYGLFVTIDEQTGLLHKTQCSNWIDLVKRYPKGSEIYVKVLDVIPKGPKLQYAGPALVKKINEENLKVGEVYKARVSGTQVYGVFLRLGIHSGLIHRAELPKHVDIMSHYSKGTELDVLLVNINDDGKLVFKLAK
ncbi:S1 RNA-binding domain-containing protein [Enterobacter mori]|uniref:S1 RNA-binding domain-containing protein n=1 Tax=Enterobacter mori TaxID=539813 RepID=UPI00397C40C7